MQSHMQWTQNDQLELQNNLGQQKVEQHLGTEDAEENPDADILDQMQMVAPAPVPQPAQPLQPPKTRE